MGDKIGSSSTFVEYDSSVPTEEYPEGIALWWLVINAGTGSETYVSLSCKPTDRQIRHFKKIANR